MLKLIVNYLHLILKALSEILKARVGVLSHSLLHLDARLLHLRSVKALHFLKRLLQVRNPYFVLQRLLLLISSLLVLAKRLDVLMHSCVRYLTCAAHRGATLFRDFSNIIGTRFIFLVLHVFHLELDWYSRFLSLFSLHSLPERLVHYVDHALCLGHSLLSLQFDSVGRPTLAPAG